MKSQKKQDTKLGNITNLDDICGKQRLEKITQPTVVDPNMKPINSKYKLVIRNCK